MKRLLSFLIVASLLTGVSFAQEAAVVETAPVATEEVVAPVEKKVEEEKKRKVSATVEGDAWFAATVDGSATTKNERHVLNNVSLNAKSRLKINMNLFSKVSSYVEVLALNNENKRGNIWHRDGGATGFRDMFLYGLLAKPIDHWGQGDKDEVIMLDQVKFGVDTKWLDWETGFLNAEMPSHKIGGWDVVKDIKGSTDKHGGYGWFGMERDVKKNGLKGLGPVGLNAALSFSHNSKNISVFNGKNGGGFGSLVDMFGFVDIGLFEDTSSEKAEDRYMHNVGVQFDSAFSLKNEDKDVFIPSGDIIVGYKGRLPLGLSLSANVLFNMHNSDLYKRPEKLSAMHDMAFAAKVGWKGAFVDKLELGVKTRGERTNLIFVKKVGDVLGDKNSLKFALDDNFKIGDGIKLGVDGDVAFTFDKKAVEDGVAKPGAGNHKDNMKYGIKPHVDFDLNAINATISAYGKFRGVTRDEDKVVFGVPSESNKGTKFYVEDVGVKFSHGSDKKQLSDVVNYYSVYADWYTGAKSKDAKGIVAMLPVGRPFSFATLSGEVKLLKKIGVNGGVGIRIPNKGVKASDSEKMGISPVGFFLGADYKFDDKTIGGPTVFVRTQVGMKGYKKIDDGINKVNRGDHDYVIKGYDMLRDWDLSTGIKWTF